MVTVTGSWSRSQHQGFWLVWKAPSGPSRSELAPPVLPSETQAPTQDPVLPHPMPCQRLSFYPTSATTKDGGGGTGHIPLPCEPETPWAVLGSS